MTDFTKRQKRKPKNNEPLTKCIVHSGLVVNTGSVAIIKHRQIYRFDYFKGGKFGSLGN